MKTETLSDKSYRINMGHNWIKTEDVREFIQKIADKCFVINGFSADARIVVDIEDVKELAGEELANHRQEKSKGVMKNSPATNNYEDTHKELANHSPQGENVTPSGFEDTQKGCKELYEEEILCNGAEIKIVMKCGTHGLCPKCSEQKMTDLFREFVKDTKQMERYIEWKRDRNFMKLQKLKKGAEDDT